ncbi:hypothetical protein [Hymenobacter sp.]|jgi:hypothetical protein|uniref:hypothetical protein n=1 Tax=Hymenobacter sp. TaxID=1898978 RepID=UPI002EDAF9C4
MKTFILTLPDYAEIAPHELYALQAALVQSMVKSGQLNPEKPEHRQALEEWSDAVKATYQPPTDEENERAKAEFRRQHNWPEPDPSVSVEELTRRLDEAMDSLFETQGLTAETYEQWVKDGGMSGRKSSAA